MGEILKKERNAVTGRERKALAALLAERRATLQKHAFGIGQKLFAEKPKAFRQRIGEYVDAWA